MIMHDDLSPGVTYKIRGMEYAAVNDVLRAIFNKAKEYGIGVGFRNDCVYADYVSAFLGVLKSERVVLFDISSGTKASHYTMGCRVEGAYLFLTFCKHRSCPYHWGLIMDDILDELFSSEGE